MLSNYRGLWPLCACLMLACTDSTGSGGGHTDNVGGGDDDDSVNPGGNTGTLIGHGSIDGNDEDCQMVVDGEQSKDTGEKIDLEVGTHTVTVGDVNVTTLGRVPLHENDSGFWLGQEQSVNIAAGKTTEVSIGLSLAPKYECESFQCNYPYEGGSCTARLDNETQWITLEGDNLVGENGNGFAGQGTDDDEYTLVGDTLTLVSTPIPDMVMIESSFDPVTLSFSYTLVSDGAQSAVEITCSLE